MKYKCIKCDSIFKIDEDDKKLLMKLSPKINWDNYSFELPKLCHDCRSQRRMAFRKEFNFYSRKCDYSWEECISLYSSTSPYTVYKDSIWWSDVWDARDYWINFDFEKSFFEQLDNLIKVVPRKSMQQNDVVENSEYTSYTSASKNCYILSSSGYCEDVYYGVRMIMAKNCVDCSACFSSELLYECLDCHWCYNSYFLQNCNHCQDSYFLENCRNVHHSIACKNLRSKWYHIFNKAVSKEEFEKLKDELHLNWFEKMKEKFKKWWYKIPTIFSYIHSSENCSWNMIENSKNCHNCFSIALWAQDLRHCMFCWWKWKDMMDCLWSWKESELLYESIAVVTSHKIAFCNSIESSSECYYSECLKNCHNCFWCVWLTNEMYCILNKKYTKEEYEELIPQIINNMKTFMEWWENLPIQISPFYYNETMAQDYFPITKEYAKENYFKWNIINEKILDVEKIIPSDKLPISIKDIPDDILNWAIKCNKTNKPYIITEQELLFYRNMNISIPKKHPEVRHIERENRRAWEKLYKRLCNKCNKQLNTVYSSDDPYKIYCEKCFWNIIYFWEEEFIWKENHNLNEKTKYKIKSSYRDYSNIAKIVKTIVINKFKK